MADILSQPQIIMITGLMASGKSTVAQALAERLPKSVHLRGDLFRRMIVRGQEPMGYELGDEALRQLYLRYQIAAAAARMYLQAGFTVVYQDIILGPDLEKVASEFEGLPLSLFVLCPDPRNIAAREAARPKTGYQSEAEIYQFDKALRAQTPKIGFWLDSSRLTAAETVDHLLAHLQQARI